MKLPGVFKSLGEALLTKVKKSPKTAVLVVAGIVGGSLGASITKVVTKLPDISLDGEPSDETDQTGA